MFVQLQARHCHLRRLSSLLILLTTAITDFALTKETFAPAFTSPCGDSKVQAQENQVGCYITSCALPVPPITTSTSTTTTLQGKQLQAATRSNMSSYKGSMNALIG